MIRPFTNEELICEIGSLVKLSSGKVYQITMFYTAGNKVMAGLEPTIPDDTLIENIVVDAETLLKGFKFLSGSPCGYEKE